MPTSGELPASGSKPTAAITSCALLRRSHIQWRSHPTVPICIGHSAFTVAIQAANGAMAMSRQRRLHLAVNGAIPISDRCNDGDEQTATITSCCKLKMQCVRHAIYECLRTISFVHIGHSVFTVAIPSYCPNLYWPQCIYSGDSILLSQGVHCHQK